MSWEKVKVKDFAGVITGGTPSTTKKEYWENGDIPWLNSGELNKEIINYSDNYITELGLENSSARMMPKGSVLIALTGATTGKTAFLNIEACANQSVTGILPSKNHISEYLFFYLKGQREKILNDAYGGAQKHISQGYVKELEIPLPPLPTQKAIAEKLDKANALRKKDQELLKSYDELAQSVFIEMFGDPVRNEKGWEKVEFGKIVKNLNSKRVPLKSSYRDNLEEIYPYYGASGIIDYVDDYLFEGDNLLIGEDGANLLSRSTPIAFIATGKYWVNNHAHVLGFEDKAELEFLKFFVNSIDLTPYITGSAQPKLTRGNLDNIEIYLPPLPLQQKFAQIIENIEGQKAVVKQQVKESENLFQALLQESFS